MKHARVSSAWRPVRARGAAHVPQDVLSAFVFNACMVVLAVASAIAVMVIGRDQLYAYEYSDAGARVIGDRVERLNAEMIQLDFDRQNQWDNLVAMELATGDISAARGFLLSGGHMLPQRTASILNRADNDAELELTALELLTPGTRARYEELVPLLSRRATTVSAELRGPGTVVPLGDQQDFELMARAMIAEPESDALQFILTGLSLGLAGEFSARANDGAVAVVAASRRPDYPVGFDAELDALSAQAVSIAAFRTAALASAEPEAASRFDNAAAAFRAAINPVRAQELREALEQVGAMSEAVSIPAATDMISHAATLSDLPRLRLVAQAAGDRAAAAAKRLPRDGRLIATARGDLTITRELGGLLAVASLALVGMIGILGFKAYRFGRRVVARFEDDDEYGAELVDMGGAGNWRPL